MLLDALVETLHLLPAPVNAALQAALLAGTEYASIFPKNKNTLPEAVLLRPLAARFRRVHTGSCSVSSAFMWRRAPSGPIVAVRCASPARARAPSLVFERVAALAPGTHVSPLEHEGHARALIQRPRARHHRMLEIVVAVRHHRDDIACAELDLEGPPLPRGARPQGSARLEVPEAEAARLPNRNDGGRARPQVAVLGVGVVFARGGAAGRVEVAEHAIEAFACVGEQRRADLEHGRAAVDRAWSHELAGVGERADAVFGKPCGVPALEHLRAVGSQQRLLLERDLFAQPRDGQAAHKVAEMMLRAQRWCCRQRDDARDHVEGKL
mmetsp:Transcript_811/g.1860  ORF Transcript_811/g.1860 Transcript_811/m.1860 type:complete len:325 (+) Transcript_811:102-1076(+)